MDNRTTGRRNLTSNWRNSEQTLLPSRRTHASGAYVRPKLRSRSSAVSTGQRSVLPEWRSHCKESAWWATTGRFGRLVEHPAAANQHVVNTCTSRRKLWSNTPPVTPLVRRQSAECIPRSLGIPPDDRRFQPNSLVRAWCTWSISRPPKCRPAITLFPLREPLSSALTTQPRVSCGSSPIHVCRHTRGPLDLPGVPCIHRWESVRDICRVPPTKGLSPPALSINVYSPDFYALNFRPPKTISLSACRFANCEARWSACQLR